MNGSTTPMALARLAESVWYGGHPLSLALLPVSWLYCGLVRLRRLAYWKTWLSSYRLPVPVIVVGNLTVGGSGKTPLVLAVVDLLRRRGYRPGILTRGYGGRGTRWPRLVQGDSDPFEVGDEPVLLAQRSGCPVAAGADRVVAAKRLLADCECDLIVSDDGLQHYRLRRDMEVLVIDASRQFGNGRCLPAGPLREPASRQRVADLILYHKDLHPASHPALHSNPHPRGQDAAGQDMYLIPERLVNLTDRKITRGLEELRQQRVTAVAGIGNPDRFFALLRRQGLYVHGRPYPDHHPFSHQDAASWPPGPVIMTAKDAVKCAGFARPDFWYLSVTAQFSSEFERLLVEKLEGIDNG